MDYVVPLDPELVDRAQNLISGTENLPPRVPREDPQIGKTVDHPVFGPGKIIGVPRDQSGYIIQFDRIPTPRTLSKNICLALLQ